MKSTDRSAKRKSMGQSQLLLTLTQESIWVTPLKISSGLLNSPIWSQSLICTKKLKINLFTIQLTILCRKTIPKTLKGTNSRFKKILIPIVKANFRGIRLKRLWRSLQVVWVAQITSRTLTVEGGFTNKIIQRQEKT
jgi:hypothetical protein